MASLVQIFPQEVIPIPDIETYYSLDHVTVPENRPYTWSMSVSTLDGYISFKDPGAEGAKEVSLGHIPNSGSGADFRLLNAGWMYADAVLGSGSILRSEPDILWTPLYDDLQAHRVNVFKKSKYPIAVILSGSGDLNLNHKMFHTPELRTVIVTTKRGYEKLKPQLNLLTDLTSVEVVGNDQSTSFGGDEFVKIMEILRKKYEVKFLDVTAGGIVIGTLFWHKLVDEMRVTVAGQVCGPSAHNAIARPLLFQPPPNCVFDHTNNPVLKYTKIGLYGDHHIFLRTSVQYRN